MLSVLMFRNWCTHGICIRCFSGDAQVPCIACNNWDTLGGWFDAIESRSHGDCKSCGKIIAQSNRIYRGFHSRAVASVVSLRLERAFALGALVFRTREALSAFVGRAAAFAASYLSTFGC